MTFEMAHPLSSLPQAEKAVSSHQGVIAGVSFPPFD
jgi:hypothetical protein